jgi:hypothetical protein
MKKLLHFSMIVGAIIASIASSSGALQTPERIAKPTHPITAPATRKGAKIKTVMKATHLPRAVHAKRTLGKRKKFTKSAMKKATPMATKKEAPKPKG